MKYIVAIFIIDILNDKYRHAADEVHMENISGPNFFFIISISFRASIIIERFKSVMSVIQHIAQDV